MAWAQAAGCGQGHPSRRRGGQAPAAQAPHIIPSWRCTTSWLFLKSHFQKVEKKTSFFGLFPPFFFCERLGERCGGRREPGRAGGTSGSTPTWAPGPLLTAPQPRRPWRHEAGPLLGQPGLSCCLRPVGALSEPTLHWSTAGWGLRVSTLMGCRACGERGQQRSAPGLGGWGAAELPGAGPGGGQGGF